MNTKILIMTSIIFLGVQIMPAYAGELCVRSMLSASISEENISAATNNESKVFQGSTIQRLRRLMNIKKYDQMPRDELTVLGLDIPVVLNGLMHPVYAAYLGEIKAIANSESSDFTALYGGSGADISSFLHATNATTGVFVDSSGFDMERFNEMLEQWDDIPTDEILRTYRTKKFKNWFAGSGQEGFRGSIALALAGELHALGVKRESIHLTSLSERDKVCQIQFSWGYPGEEAKTRTLYFAGGDIACPQDYSPTLAKLLGVTLPKRGWGMYGQPDVADVPTLKFDTYFQRAGVTIATMYRSFIPQVVVPAMKKRAFFLTDDRFRNDDGEEGVIIERSPFFDEQTLPDIRNMTQHVPKTFTDIADILFDYESSWRIGEDYDGVYGYGRIISVREIEKNDIENPVFFAA